MSHDNGDFCRTGVMALNIVKLKEKIKFGSDGSNLDHQDFLTSEKSTLLKERNSAFNRSAHFDRVCQRDTNCFQGFNLVPFN